MTEAERRAAIVTEAMTWERTPYMPHARIKGVGVDCAQLPALVYAATGCIPELKPEYSSQWMNHRDEELYLEEIRRWAREIDENELQPGDLVVWKFGRTYSHSAIVIDPPIVLHALIKAGAVVRADMNAEEDFKRVNRPRKCFSVFTADGDLVGGR
jgi:cell wall-associated NlpC family hydrolase